jgi:hypothetical protein
MGFLSNIFSKRPASDPIAALLAEAARDPARRKAFYLALLDATLWMPAEMEEGEMFVRPYEVHGRKVVLAFTSRDLATSLRDKPSMLELPARSVLSAGAGFDGLVLNYGTPGEKEFTGPEMRSLLDGSIFDLVDGERALLLGQPKEFPVRLMNDLARAFPSRREIGAAYIAQVAEAGEEGDPAIVIGIDTTMSDEEFEDVRAKLERMAEIAEAPGVLFMKLGDDPVAHYMRAETKPFYRNDEL